MGSKSGTRALDPVVPGSVVPLVVIEVAMAIAIPRWESFSHVIFTAYYFGTNLKCLWDIQGRHPLLTGRGLEVVNKPTRRYSCQGLRIETNIESIEYLIYSFLASSLIPHGLFRLPCSCSSIRMDTPFRIDALHTRVRYSRSSYTTVFWAD